MMSPDTYRRNFSKLLTAMTVADEAYYAAKKANEALQEKAARPCAPKDRISWATLKASDDKTEKLRRVAKAAYWRHSKLFNDYNDAIEQAA